MVLNNSKFEHLEYASHLPYGVQRQFTTKEGIVIGKPEVVKDLGVFMCKDATFIRQIQEMISKANRQAGWILRTFRCRDPISMITLFKATVLPLLEYCSQLWSPGKVGEIRRLESVQRNFTYRVSGMNGLSYWDRLKRLNLYSLERRRERYAILYVYKIYRGIAPNFENERWTITTRYSERRGLH